MLERYYPIVDDVEAFIEAASRPQPLFAWTHILRTTSRQLIDVLTSDGYELTPLDWHPQAYRVNCQHADERLGRHWTYLAGWFHIQEASSMIPALILNPQAGERVLDLCAAPGNKTALMAQALENRGTVVANDVFWERIRPLRSAIDRLGLLNVSVTCHDGTAYPRAAGEFDCVLVDVPCSCEGTSRRFPGILKRAPFQHMPKRFHKQQLLLEAAIRRCRFGGRILYSTCTYAPEENEAVVDAVLRKMPGLVRILPVSLPGLNSTPGLTDWAGESFHTDLQHSLRIWPHLNDTGGFYIALLEKIGGSSRKKIQPPEIVQPDFQTAAGSTQQRLDDAGRMFDILAERFGIERAAFDGLQFLEKSRRDIYAVAADHQPPQMAKCISGLPLFHMHFKYPKPTTSCAAAFGRKADRNVIDASYDQLQAYLARKPFTLQKDQARACNGSGYVLVRHQNVVLGVGFYDQNQGVVASLLPKSMTVM
ncbi:MAG: RsmB/NOP family class I SAM-dependent RNA methyltransferase [Deltaproteobacteria bacterium]|jgi:NOL1/NOP2/sun family putative RNA methylase|nr:RsmB/NOP family class I SAM-dependent RNA methyltransferase [Deltaproteobacteria bacterium]